MHLVRLYPSYRHADTEYTVQDSAADEYLVRWVVNEAAVEFGVEGVGVRRASRERHGKVGCWRGRWRGEGISCI